MVQPSIGGNPVAMSDQTRRRSSYSRLEPRLGPAGIIGEARAQISSNFVKLAATRSMVINNSFRSTTHHPTHSPPQWPTLSERGHVADVRCLEGSVECTTASPHRPEDRMGSVVPGRSYGLCPGRGLRFTLPRLNSRSRSAATTSRASSASETSKASGALSAVSLISRELLEQFALAGEDLGDALVDAFFGEQAVDLHGVQLAHSVGAGDGLPFGGRLELRFADDHDGGGLDVEPDAAGDDLRHQDSTVPGGGELVDHDLPGGRGHRSGERAEDLAGQGRGRPGRGRRGSGRRRSTRRPLSSASSTISMSRCTFSDLCAVRHGGLAHGHEVPGRDGVAVGGGVARWTWAAIPRPRPVRAARSGRLLGCGAGRPGRPGDGTVAGPARWHRRPGLDAGSRRGCGTRRCGSPAVFRSAGSPDRSGR